VTLIFGFLALALLIITALVWGLYGTAWGVFALIVAVAIVINLYLFLCARVVGDCYTIAPEDNDWWPL